MLQRLFSMGLILGFGLLVTQGCTEQARDLGIGVIGKRSTFLETVKRLYFLRRNIVVNSPDIVVGFPVNEANVCAGTDVK